MLRLFRKDLILFFKDQRSFILTFLIPVILITVFAFAYGAIGNYSDSSESLELLVVDQDKTNLSGQFISDLDSLKAMTIINSEFDKARDLIVKGKYAVALVLGIGFQDSFYSGNNIPVQLLYDEEQEPETWHVQSIIVNTLISYSRKIEIQKYYDAYKNIFADSGSSVSVLPAMPADKHESLIIERVSIVGKKKDIDLGLIQAVAGTAILMLLFSTAGVGTSILEEKENGTINRLLYSPLNSKIILYSKMLFAFFIAILQLSVMFLFSWIFLGLDITLNIKGLVLMIVTTAFAVSSLGIFLASIAKSRQQAQNLSNLIILVMSAIGGSMIPLFYMPAIMSKVAIFSINYWGIQGFYDVLWRLRPVSEMYPKMLVLIGSGIIMTLLSIKLINKNIIKLI